MTGSLFEDIPHGATISAITPLASDPNLRRIRVDGKVVATLRATDIEALKLEIGRRWAAALAKAVLEAAERNKARKAAMQWLGRRAHSSGEIIDKLIAKGHPRATAHLVAEELVADRWIDDAEFARAVAREAVRKRPASERLILGKLRDRKIDERLAKKILQETLLNASPLEQAMSLAKTKLASMQSLPTSTVQRRIAGLLARRGFDEEIVMEAIQQLGLADEFGNCRRNSTDEG